jgi:hypothetical protein
MNLGFGRGRADTGVCSYKNMTLANQNQTVVNNHEKNTLFANQNHLHVGANPRVRPIGVKFRQDRTYKMPSDDFVKNVVWQGDRVGNKFRQDVCIRPENSSSNFPNQLEVHP